MEEQSAKLLQHAWSVFSALMHSGHLGYIATSHHTVAEHSQFSPPQTLSTCIAMLFATTDECQLLCCAQDTGKQQEDRLVAMLQPEGCVVASPSQAGQPAALLSQ